MNLNDNIINCSVLFILQLLNNIDCFFVPYTYNLAPLSDFGKGIIPYSLVYNPFTLNPEPDALANGQKSYGLAMSPPFVNKDDVDSVTQKAYSCSLMTCLDDDTTAVCACNFKTGNVVTFKNNCDVKKHNCRFDTEFRTILNEICPWEFQSRRLNTDIEIDYSDPKYYN